MSLNPYQAHAVVLAQLQAELGGGVTYAGHDIPAVVGLFEVMQLLRPDGGGFVPSLAADVIVQKTDCPATITMKTGHAITVTAPRSNPRACQIVSITDLGDNWRIVVSDANQAA
jgi:hypothetical protein